MKFPLPPHIIELVDAADRKALGLKTREEAIAAAEVKSERDLHRQVGALLRLRGIEYFESRMDKPTTQRRGVPDILFCVTLKVKGPGDLRWPVGVGWELKLPGKKLDPDQEQMLERMTSPPNAWCVRCVHSVDEALMELKRLGL